VRYKLYWMIVLSIDGLVDYLESVDIVFDEFDPEGDFRIYYTWVDPEFLILLNLKFPELNQYKLKKYNEIL